MRKYRLDNDNRFLRSLDVTDTVELRDYAQYNDLIMDIMEEIKEASLEYLIEYKKNKKDFPVYTVKEVYED